MRILIGGSPSTGSSVFRQILNRHPMVFCGPETNLFCYAELYRHWKLARFRMHLTGLLGLHRVDVRLIKGVHLDDKEFDWSANRRNALIRSKDTFTGFCDTFFARPMEADEKTIWAEKTPANVLMFPQFMKTFDDAYIIHNVRCPYDTVTSLVARGMTPYQAASVYLVYTAHGLATQHMPGYIEARYESLVSAAHQTLESKILEPLGLQFSQQMLLGGNPNMSGVTKMQGWQLDELAKVSDQSLSRFQRVPAEMQHLIISAISMVRVNSAYAQQFQLRHTSIAEICADLKYEYHDIVDIKSELINTFRQDRQRIIKELRWHRLFGTSTKYPVEVGDQ